MKASWQGKEIPFNSGTVIPMHIMEDKFDLIKTIINLVFQTNVCIIVLCDPWCHNHASQLAGSLGDFKWHGRMGKERFSKWVMPASIDGIFFSRRQIRSCFFRWDTLRVLNKKLSLYKIKIHEEVSGCTSGSWPFAMSP